MCVFSDGPTRASSENDAQAESPPQTDAPRIHKRHRPRQTERPLRPAKHSLAASGAQPFPFPNRSLDDARFCRIARARARRAHEQWSNRRRSNSRDSSKREAAATSAPWCAGPTRRNLKTDFHEKSIEVATRRPLHASICIERLRQAAKPFTQPTDPSTRRARARQTRPSFERRVPAMRAHARLPLSEPQGHAIPRAPRLSLSEVRRTGCPAAPRDRQQTRSLSAAPRPLALVGAARPHRAHAAYMPPRPAATGAQQAPTRLGPRRSPWGAPRRRRRRPPRHG